MHLSSIRLRDFRNYRRLDAEFSPGFHLLLGQNAQGKTNILEAIYLLATLRSFRGIASSQMVHHGAKGYFIGAKVENKGLHEIKVYWAPRERNLTLDGNPIKRISDYLGVLRAVVFCTEDLQLVKGTSSRRRRFIDLLLSQTQPSYLGLLQRYGQAVRSRNALLKQKSIHESALESFTEQMVASGTQIIHYRTQIIPRLRPLLLQAFQSITSGVEELSIEYQPSVKEDFLVELRQSTARERAFRTTVVGPHRDEIQLLIDGHSASQFGSEGQKRSVAIALKMAQTEYLTQWLGSPPLLLIDDIMGELDLQRRSGLLPLLQRVHQARSQVFMTCTEENWPAELGSELIRWQVSAGKLIKDN
ncbi:MAG: DNA replication/repair protein RecF [Verrucomicrobiales bacterium]